VGETWAPRSHELRELLGRNGVPFGFYPADGPDGERLLEEAGAAGMAAARFRDPTPLVAAGTLR
jgi:thioredoxin reductase (NADPH)